MPIHSTSHNGATTVPSLTTGKVVDSGELALTGEQTFSTTGTSNDVALNGGVAVFRATGGSAQTLTGITGGYNGRLLLVVNEGSGVTFSHENAGSTASNRFTLRNASALVLVNAGALLLRYDGSSSRWRVMATSTSQFNDQLTASNSFVASSKLFFSNNNSPTAISGTNNDWAPTASFRYRIAASAAATVTGLSSQAGTGGAFTQFQNLSAFNITLTHEGAGSTAANRFTCPRSVDLVIPPNGNAYLIYDTTTSRWIVFGDASCWSQGASTLSGDLIYPPWTSGRYYATPTCAVVTTSNTLANGTFRSAATYIPSPITVTRMAAEITAAGDAGSKLRLGIYADDGTGRPGALVLDAGTIPADAVAAAEITGLSTAIGPGWYWFGAAVQLVTVTQPTVRVVSGVTGPPVDYGTTLPTAGTSATGFSFTGATGALPGTFGTIATHGAVPRIYIKT